MSRVSFGGVEARTMRSTAAAASPARTALQTVYDNRIVAGSPAAAAKPAASAPMTASPPPAPTFDIVAPRVAADATSTSVNPSDIEFACVCRPAAFSRLPSPSAPLAASRAVGGRRLVCSYCVGVRTGLTIELVNTSALPMCYKIQTSNPTRYAVTPR